MGVSFLFDEAQNVGSYSLRSVCLPLKSDERLRGDKPSITSLKSLLAGFAFSLSHTHTHAALSAAAFGLVPSQLREVDGVEGLGTDSSDTALLPLLSSDSLVCAWQITDP